jgi:hypothetical protein
MADVINKAYGQTTIGANYKKHGIATSDAGRTLIISISKTNMVDADLEAILAYLTLAHGANGEGDSAFTIAGVGTADGSPFVSGATDVVFIRAQGTGTFTASDAAAGTGATVAVVAIFQPAK